MTFCSEGEDKRHGFPNRLNHFHPNLRMKNRNVSVSIVYNKLETDLFCKPTDCHQFLHLNSAHPFHDKKLIVYSQRFCSFHFEGFVHLHQLSKTP